MKKFLIPVLGLMFLQTANAQLSLNGHFYGEDALKFNTYNPGVGTAKVIGMGGSFTALGGDASNAYLNPAGLGFYNKSEFSVSPVFGNYSSNAKYIGVANNTSSSDLKMGQLAVVFSSRGAGTRKKRSAWAISYNNLANFQSNYDFSGTNNKSSISDFFAQRATQRGVSSETLDKEFNTNTIQTQNITSLAYQAYLIEPLPNNAYEAGELSIPIEQSGNVNTKGRLGQINLSYGVNYDNKTYVGLGLGIQNLSHTQLTSLNERFPKGVIFNGFDFYDELYTSGTGLNLNLGVIYKLTENVRLGAAIISPTAMRTSETYIAGVVIDLKPGTFETSNKAITTVPNDFSYRITSPLRASTGLSFFLPKKLGAINLDAEYIGYSKMGIKDTEDAKWSSDQKQGIQNQYKDVLNLKVGAELRFGNARLRGGLAYNQNPTKNQAAAVLSKATIVSSIGAGFRTDRFFGDVAFNATKRTFGYTPYAVANAADYASVAVDSKNTMVAFTIGTFF
jgi:Outer membrane protein transport protein (OMPP1/FadL/TodX)